MWRLDGQSWSDRPNLVLAEPGRKIAPAPLAE